MRTYHGTGYRTLAGGAIELEGRWSGVRWIALALLPVLFLGLRSPTVLGVVGAAAVYLFVFPARRRIVFDPQRASLRIEHAGAFAERGTRVIPFEDLRGLVFESAGRQGGRALHAVFARTSRGRVYLLTHAGKREAEDLASRLEALVRA
jgi:hypothetical protein